MKRKLFELVQLPPEQQNAILRHTLTGASYVFEMISSTKRLWQEKYYQPKLSLPIETISFGNFTWGGTGKTPCLHYTAKYLEQRHGKKALFLSRVRDEECCLHIFIDI